MKKTPQKEPVNESPAIQIEEPLRREKVVKFKEKSQFQLRKEILKRKVAACGGIDKLERQDLTMFDLIYFNPSEPGKE